MRLITRTEGPAAELLGDIAKARQAGELIQRVELTDAEYQALIADLETAMGADLRSRGPMAAFDGVPLYVDGKPPAARAAGIVVPQAPGVPGGGQRQ